MSWITRLSLITRRYLVPVICRSQAHTVAITRDQVNGSGIATVSLNRLPVNSFNIPFTLELTKILSEIENSGEVDAVIIKSSLPEVFSAGLDLNELYGTSREYIESFWHAFQDLWFRIYSSKLITLSVINGHCLAAGTVISAACDYRLGIKGRYSIGVPAAKVGLVAPPWFLATLSTLIGKRKTEHALQTGKTFSPTEAMDIGLIDCVCTAREANEAAMQVLAPYLSVCQLSRKTMKEYLRADLLADFEQTREKDMYDFVDYVMKDSVQRTLYDYIQNMKRK